MTNHIDPKQIAKAKEWAETVELYSYMYSHAELIIARIVANLPDQIIDAEKVRELLDRWAVNPFPTSDEVAVLNDVEALLPTPPLPTLADLIEQGHDTAQYQWGQAEHRDERCVISRVNSQAFQPAVSLLTATGATIWASADEVIPLPDKPRLLWPASAPEPAEEIPTPEVPPKVLVTEEDYREAPDGTICAGGMGLPFHTSTRAWRSTSGIRHDHRDLSGTPRRVLRWGMGEQV